MAPRASILQTCGVPTRYAQDAGAGKGTGHPALASLLDCRNAAIALCGGTQDERGVLAARRLMNERDNRRSVRWHDCEAKMPEKLGELVAPDLVVLHGFKIKRYAKGGLTADVLALLSLIRRRWEQRLTTVLTTSHEAGNLAALISESGDRDIGEMFNGGRYDLTALAKQVPAERPSPTPPAQAGAPEKKAQQAALC
jgi:hypothetical protein